jgi:hypothetical protein
MPAGLSAHGCHITRRFRDRDPNQLPVFCRYKRMMAGCKAEAAVKLIEFSLLGFSPHIDLAASTEGAAQYGT